MNKDELLASIERREPPTAEARIASWNAAVDQLVKNEDADALAWLRDVVELPRKSAKHLRRGIHRLASRGVDIPDKPASRASIAAVSEDVDPLTEYSGLLSGPFVGGVVRFVFPQIAPDRQIALFEVAYRPSKLLDAYVAWIPKSRYREIVVEQQSAFRAADLFCARLTREARAWHLTRVRDLLARSAVDHRYAQRRDLAEFTAQIGWPTRLEEHPVLAALEFEEEPDTTPDLEAIARRMVSASAFPRQRSLLESHGANEYDPRTPAREQPDVTAAVEARWIEDWGRDVVSRFLLDTAHALWLERDVAAALVVRRHVDVLEEQGNSPLLRAVVQRAYDRIVEISSAGARDLPPSGDKESAPDAPRIVDATGEPVSSDAPTVTGAGEDAAHGGKSSETSA